MSRIVFRHSDNIIIDRTGGGVTPAVLPRHRTNGFVSGGS